MEKQPATPTIVGQDTLLKEVKRIFEIFTGSNCSIRPHFILTGQSGTGKSLTMRTMAGEHKLVYVEVNAAQLTKEGTSGNSLSKALSPLLQNGNKPALVFVDEFDKLFISGNSNSSLAHETTTGVQNEFLKVLESDIASVYGDYGKYISASVKNVLFVFAGAFNGEPDMTLDKLRAIGLKTEFLGRVGLVYNTQPLSLEHMYDIIDHAPLLDNYIKLFPDVDREKVALEIKAYVRDNFEHNTIGARLINTLINQYFIRGGKLGAEEVKEISFQKKLEL